MKTILLALGFGLLLPACVDNTASTTPASEATEAAANTTAPSDQREANETSSPLPAATSCLELCATRYEACLGRAQDAVDECLCFNTNVSCRRGCGVPGFVKKC